MPVLVTLRGRPKFECSFLVPSQIPTHALLVNPNTEQMLDDMDYTKEHIHAFLTSIHSFSTVHHEYRKLYQAVEARYVAHNH